VRAHSTSANFLRIDDITPSGTGTPTPCLPRLSQAEAFTLTMVTAAVPAVTAGQTDRVLSGCGRELRGRWVHTFRSRQPWIIHCTPEHALLIRRTSNQQPAHSQHARKSVFTPHTHTLITIF